MARDSATLDQIIKGYEPNMQTPVLFTIPGGPGQPGNTIDVNSLTENAVDQLIAQYGGHGPLIGRKSYLQAQREKGENTAAANKTTEEQIQAEALKRTDAALQQKLDSIFGQVANSSMTEIENRFAPIRGKAISEEAALGRLTSPISLTQGSPISQVDTNKANTMSQVFGNIANQRAAGQMDFSKTIESILQGERRAADQRDQFGKNYDLEKNQFQAQLNEGAANRALSQSNLLSQLTHDTDMNTPSDWDRVTGQINTGLDMFSKIFPMQVPGGEGGSVTRAKKKPSMTGDPASDKAFLSILTGMPS